MATTTPNYGWPVPTSTDLVKDGATAIEDLGDAIDATVFGLPDGLNLISSTAIGSGVASVTVSGCFTTTYNNYRVILSNMDASGNVSIFCRFNNSGSGASAYKRAMYFGTYAGAALTAVCSATASFIYVGFSGTTTDTAIAFDVINPFIAQPTGIIGLSIGDSGLTWAGGLTTAALSETGFTLTPDSGTFTGGTVAVYGYKK